MGREDKFIFFCITYNFRGVGRSTGTYGGGIGEQEDLRIIDAAINRKYADILHPKGFKRKILIGYSFGAIITLGVYKSLNDIDGIILISYPFGFLGKIKPDYELSVPALFIQGDKDEIAGYTTFQKEYKNFSGKKQFYIEKNADHFYIGHENNIGAAVVEFINEIYGENDNK